MTTTTMTTTDIAITARQSLDAIAADPDCQGCPCCGSDGLTPEQYRRELPRLYAALVSCSGRVTPEEPRAACVDCRQMIGAGMDPTAILREDMRESAIAAALDGDGFPRRGQDDHAMLALIFARRAGAAPDTLRALERHASPFVVALTAREAVRGGPPGGDTSSPAYLAMRARQ